MKKRRDSFFGLHFDFHAGAESRVAEEMRPDVIARLLDELEITQEQADELNALAEQYGGGATVEERLAAVEAAALEHDAALTELAQMLTAGGEA